ncbi:MAG: ATP-binding cassette domain-containing protein [Defluviitaleaceae bacterium]|nr:ATP-binding cassette domain-containing protein [Defluviitaleaceae bacterium]
MPLLEVKNLQVHFPIRGGILGRTVGHTKAVDGISFQIEPGQTVGLVGESGSGKSTTGKAILGLVRLCGGRILFDGEDITGYIGRNRSPYRRGVQMIFQDVYSSLNPRKRVLDVIAEPIRNFERMTKAEELRRVHELLEVVGLSADSALKYPHEFSGGQRQRIGVARAIALRPKLIVADEPVSALDLSVQAQVLNYMKDIQRELGLAYLFISHDLGVVRHMCERLLIMHRARFVETGTREEIYNNPMHIYTRRLIAAIPDMNPAAREANEARRKSLEREYNDQFSKFYDADGSVYDLARINDDHSVAIPG